MVSISDAQAAVTQLVNSQAFSQAEGINEERFSQLIQLLNGVTQSDLSASSNTPESKIVSDTSQRITSAGTATGSEDISVIQNSLLNALQQSLFSSNETASPESAADASAAKEPQQKKDVKQSTATEGLLDFIDRAEKYSFGEDGLQAEDLFDAVNMLHHIPVVSDIYHHVTSDNVSSASSLVGGFLFAGPIGAAYSAADILVEKMTGDSMLSNAVKLSQDALSAVTGNGQQNPEVSTTVESKPVTLSPNSNPKLSSR